MKKSLLILALVVLTVGGFCAGLAHLFSIRYASGDVYPYYSTLRADPLGAKAIHDALAQVPGVETRRNFLALKKLKPPGPVTLVYLGTSPASFWTLREFEEFRRLVENGSRVVITFIPIEREPDAEARRREELRERRAKEEHEQKAGEKTGGDEPKKDGGGEKGNDKEKDKEDETDAPGLLSFRDVAKQLGFGFAYLPANKDRAYQRRAYLFEPGAALETDLSWHTALFFSDLDPHWKTLYLAENKPVLVERPWGRGSIVLCSDSFPFSNEALRRERHPQLLARIFAGPSPVIFDEDHLGVRDDPGVAQLVIKYRLQGVVLVLVLLAVLFVWKNATRLIPPHEEAGDRGEVASQRDAAQGFENLLQRAIAPTGLLEACADQWRRTFGRQPQALAEVVEVCAREQARPVRQRDAIAAYREIARRLAGKIRNP